MDNICYIIGAGHFEEENIIINAGDYVIAADGGYNYARKLGIIPSLVMGDFDSLDTLPENVPVERFPVMKDDTDMMLAVKKAISLGYKNIVIYGALGGERFDHTIANISLLKYMAARSVNARIKDGSFNMFAMKNSSVKLEARTSGYISIFAMEECCTGVTIKGLKYEADNICLYDSVALGVSNEFVGKDAMIEVKKGTLLILFG